MAGRWLTLATCPACDGAAKTLALSVDGLTMCDRCKQIRRLSDEDAAAIVRALVSNMDAAAVRMVLADVRGMVMLSGPGPRLDVRDGGALPQSAVCGFGCALAKGHAGPHRDAEGRDLSATVGRLPTPQEMARAQMAEWTRNTTAEPTAYAFEHLTRTTPDEEPQAFRCKDVSADGAAAQLAHFAGADGVDGWSDALIECSGECGDRTLYWQVDDKPYTCDDCARTERAALREGAKP